MANFAVYEMKVIIFSRTKSKKVEYPCSHRVVFAALSRIPCDKDAEFPP